MTNPDSNNQLRTLFEEDQQFRRHAEAYNFTDRQWQDLEEADADRRQQVRDMLNRGQVTTVGDYWRAGVIMQHGQDLDDIHTALQCSIQALKLGQLPASSLIPRAGDKLALLYQEQVGIERGKMTQLFGSQFIASRQGKIDHVYQVASQITELDKQLLAILDLNQLVGQTVAQYYQDRQQAAIQAQAMWEAMSKAEQNNFIDRTIHLINHGLLQYKH